jgi:hypothetical protein
MGYVNVLPESAPKTSCLVLANKVTAKQFLGLVILKLGRFSGSKV